MYIVNYLVNSYGKVKRVTDILDTIELVAVPFVNPDGYVVSRNFSIATTRVKGKERAINQRTKKDSDTLETSLIR